MRTCLLLILLWLCSASGWSQSHFFANISRSQGLASNDVYGVCQDSNGFYWIATDNGLQRFDGERWTRPGNETSHPDLSRPIYQVIDQDNHLFLKLEEEYAIFNTSDFSYSPVKIEHTFNTKSDSYLWKDSRGTVFLVYRGQDILAYDKNKNSFTKQAVTIKYPADFKPQTILEDTVKGHYWIGGAGGMAVFDAGNGLVYTRDNNPLRLPLIGEDKFKEVTSIFINKKRDHWIVYGGAKQKYACFSSSENNYIDAATRLPEYYKGSFSISQFFETADDQFWLFGRNALFNYMPKEEIFYNSKSDLTLSTGPKFGDVRQMMADRENGVWIATDKGIYLFYVNLPLVKIIIFKTENDDNNITSATQLPNDEIWMSSRGKGIIMLKENKRINIKSIFDRVPVEYREDAKHANIICRHSLTNKLWLGCREGIILIADPSVRTLKMLKPEPFTSSSITSISENITGQLFFGTNTGKIITGENSFRQIAKLGSAVNYLYADKQNNLWVCTESEGLYSLNASTGKVSGQYNKKNGISSDKTKKIVQVNDSIFAIAADVLNILNVNSGAVKQFSHQNGLAGNTIKTIELDSKGYLWISTSNGISRFNFNRNRFASYDETDGFIAFENAGTSSTALNDGELLMVGSNTLVSFPPDLYGNSGAPPRVHLTDIRVADKYVSTDSLLKAGNPSFAGDENSFSLYFSAMSYFLKDKLTYYYRLSGVDNDWIASNQPSAVYTLLPPGKYVFEVKCENEEGLSSPVTKFSFKIRPPFWQTWWFILLVIAAVACLLFYLHRMRINKILALSELRSRVARDLHDDVGSTLSTISILSTMARTRLNENTVMAEEYIDKISDNSQQMMEAMDDIVWSIKPMNDSMQKIIARMREVASGTLEPRNIDIDFYVDEKVFDLKLNMEARRDFFLIFKEAVNNTAKYSKCSHVLIHISYLRKRLMLKVKDNGIGFDMDKADSGNGLSNMRKRAAMLNARIKMYSDKEQGTQILLNIPIN